MNMKRIYTLLLLVVFSLSVVSSDTLIVGVKQAPPFLIKNHFGEWEGVSIDMLDYVKNKTGKTLIYREYLNDNNTIIKDIQDGDIDLYAGDLTITKERLNRIDFTQPHYQGGISVITNSDMEVSFIKSLLKSDFWYGLIVLVITILISGVILWLSERKKGNENFDDGWLGIFDGAYFSSYTMTTVGYGDILKTKIGKITAFLLMWVSIGLVGYMYGQITTALTANLLETSISDIKELNQVKVGTVYSTTSADFLDNNDIKYIGYKNAIEALNALNDGTLTAFVYDEPILRYYQGQSKYKGLHIINRLFTNDSYGFGLTNDKLRKELNPIIKELQESKQWKVILNKYQVN